MRRALHILLAALAFSLGLAAGLCWVFAGVTQ